MTSSPIQTRSPESLDLQIVSQHEAVADWGRLLNSAEVARIIRVPSATLRYWRHIGIGPKSFKMGPRRVLYREVDVLAWVAEQYGATG